MSTWILNQFEWRVSVSCTSSSIKLIFIMSACSDHKLILSLSYLQLMKSILTNLCPLINCLPSLHSFVILQLRSFCVREHPSHMLYFIYCSSSPPPSLTSCLPLSPSPTSSPLPPSLPPPSPCHCSSTCSPATVGWWPGHATHFPGGEVMTGVT